MLRHILFSRSKNEFFLFVSSFCVRSLVEQMSFLFQVQNPYLNEQDLVLPVLSTASWFIGHRLIFGAFKRYFNVAPLEDQSAENIERLKSAISAWRACMYTLSTIVGIYVLTHSDWFLTPQLYFKDFPFHPMTAPEKFYYHFAYGLSAFCLISLPLEPIRLKDFYVFAVHHIVTLFLIHTSLIYGMHRIGMAVLLCHDVADPFLEIAKIANYKGRAVLANVLFVVFALTFIISRNIIYPAYIVSSTFYYCFHEDGRPIPNGNHIVHWTAKGSLLILQALHIYWSFLIVKTAARALSPKGIKDVREKDD